MKVLKLKKDFAGGTKGMMLEEINDTDGTYKFMLRGLVTKVWTVKKDFVESNMDMFEEIDVYDGLHLVGVGTASNDIFQGEECCIYINTSGDFLVYPREDTND